MNGKKTLRVFSKFIFHVPTDNNFVLPILKCGQNLGHYISY
jgi:hypothetical protein